MRTLAEAAHARAENVRTLADRPSQRRSDVAGPANFTRAMPASIEIRAAADSPTMLHFTGHANTYEQPYEMYDAFGPYTEVVSAGAGARSLAQPGLDVPLVLDHEPLRRIASTMNGTLSLAEDAVGLLVDAPLLDLADHDVAYIAPKLRSGLITEMSFRFRILRGVWSPDYTEYRIEEYDLHRGDVSIVGYGANPYTDGELRADPAVTVFRFADLVPAGAVELDARTA